MKIIPQPFWEELNFSERGRPWQQIRAGTQRQQGCSKLPIEQLISATNHICALQPAMIFSQSFPHAYSYAPSSYPFLQWRYYDYSPNNRSVRYSIVCQGRGNESGSYFWRHGYPDIYRTGMPPGSNFEPQWTLFQFDVPRTPTANDLVSEALSKVSQATYCFDVCVQERPMSLLDTDSDTCVIPGQVSVDHSIVETTPLYDITRALHTIRSQNLPVVLSWSAFGEFDGRTQISDGHGIAITSTSAINVFDLTSTTRTAITPGQMSYVYRAACGNESNNVNVKVRVMVRARVVDNSGSASGTVRFIGPTHTGGNQCDIVVTGTSYAWVGGGVNDVIYLNAGSDYDDTATTLNKIDVHGLVSSTDVLQIIGLRAWVVKA